MTEDTSIMENSICKSCAHRICRLIVPPDYYWEELGEDPEYDGEGERVLEENFCKVMEILLDHIVLECNRFYPEEDISIIKNEDMIGS